MENVNVQDSSGRIFCRLSFSPSEDLLRVQWSGSVSDAVSVKQACNEVVRMVSQTQCSRLLSDSRGQEGPWPPLQDWLNSIWLSSLRYMGLRHFAYLHAVPHLEICVEPVSLPMEEDVAIRHFSSQEDAEQWLTVASRLVSA